MQADVNKAGFRILAFKISDEEHINIFVENQETHNVLWWETLNVNNKKHIWLLSFVHYAASENLMLSVLLSVLLESSAALPALSYESSSGRDVKA